ncbi:MAG: hypothetical protein IJK58_07330 [Clostridia bacterium]|nr:hypothetical protein [Clostridia bacterium]
MDTQNSEKKTEKKVRPEPKGSPVLFRVCSVVSAIFGIAGAIVYFFAYVNDYEPGIMHFRTGSYLIVLAGCLIAASALSALVAGIASRGTGAASRIEFPGASAVFFTFLSGLLFAAYVVSVLISSRGLPGGVLEKIALFVAAVSAVAMILRATTWGSGSGGAILSLFPVIFTGLLIFIYYFDMTTAPINSPEKGMTNVLLSVVLLFFLGDTRDRIDRISPVLAVFTRVSAAFIALPVAAVRIVLRFTSQLESPPFIVNALLISVGLFALYLLVLTGRQIRAGKQEAEPDPGKQPE